MLQVVRDVTSRLRQAPRWLPWALALLLALLAVGVVLRWPSVGPLGSDNDEYREVARALLRGDGPVTGGGVEGTKYPLGYPLLLAGIGWLRLPVTGTALVLNVLAVAVTAGLLMVLVLQVLPPTDRSGRHRWLAPVPALAAAAVCLVNVTVWDLVGMTMPDAIALAATVAVLVVAASEPSRARLWSLSVLVVVGLLLKSLSVLLVPTVLVAIAFDRRDGAARWRRQWWQPAVAGLGVVALGAAAVASLPAHTTGYASTFLLRNPGDAALGEAGLGGVLARLWTRLDIVATVAGKSVVGPQYATWWTWPVTALLVVAAIVGVRRLRPVLAVYTVAYVGLLALWPYQSPRLSLPILPVAAVGLAVVVRWLLDAPAGTGRRLAAAAMAVGLAVVGTANLARVRDEAGRQEVREAAILRDMDVAWSWLSLHGGPAPALASFDYRELAFHYDLRVLPLGYTSDLDALVAASAGLGAEWLVVVDGFAPARLALARKLTTAHPERFTRVLDTPRVDVFRIRSVA